MSHVTTSLDHSSGSIKSHHSKLKEIVMKHITQISRWLLGAALLFAAFSSPAKAASNGYVDIKVSINATKSIQVVGTTTYTFGALSLNTSSNSATAIVVRNDSGAYIETYRMQAGNAIADVAGENDWTLAASSAPDTYALAAQFSTSRPTNVADANNWDATDYLTSSAQTCTAQLFGNNTLAQSGASVSPLAASRDRNLWFRILTPDVSTGVGGRTAQVTLSIL